MNPVLRNTLFVSLLLHAVVYLWYAQTLGPMFQPQKSDSYTQEFSLVPAIEPPTPTHMQDDPLKANASDGQADSGSKTKTKKSQRQDGNADQSATLKNLLTAKESTSHAIKDSQSPAEKFALDQKMEALDDSALDNSLVESPLSTQEEEKARWKNDVLKRISEQINEAWSKPINSSRKHTGRLRLEIDADGYLKNAWVQLPSGDPNLDASAMQAVKSIWRFRIPNSKLLNRYYRNLSFNYRGG
jgi:TonB family protein